MMSRLNDSDIGYMDSEWINFNSSNQKTSKMETKREQFMRSNSLI
jgi:hypothetical protein